MYQDENIQMLGVVFCGGKSTRMGTDKGLIEIGESTWVSLAKEKLERLGIPVRISINHSQEEVYSNLFLKDELIADCFPIEGPLCGLLSAHNAFPYHDLLIIACDLKDIENTLLEKLLLELRNREGEHDFFVFENNGQYEPLLGLYTREGLQKIADLYSLNQLEKLSMKHILELGNTYAIPLSENEQSQMKNYNTL